jgi:hypothetical protein|tara:strand:- start:1115 stop:1861 length:747 start_codon:yes stop_codon:yes gene_type:complete
MALPASRTAFKEYCLRKLGYPVIEINVEDDQSEDRIDEALSFYWDYHFDGSERTFYKWTITDDDIANKYLTVPENIIGAVRIFDIGDALSTNNLFNIRYQIALNDLYDLTSFNQSLVTYYTNMMHIRFIEEILVGRQPIRYNRHINKLYVDMDWDKMQAGEKIIAECYQIVDPDTYTDVWKDRWLQNYATAKIKFQWGSNLSKFEGLQLPGGVQFNGTKIQDDALQEIAKLEEEMLVSYSLPVTDMIG